MEIVFCDISLVYIRVYYNHRWTEDSPSKLKLKKKKMQSEFLDFYSASAFALFASPMYMIISSLFFHGTLAWISLACCPLFQNTIVTGPTE